MPKPIYDIVFLTGTPSFYKTNLFNCIANERKVLVVYCGYYDGAENSSEDELNECKFDYKFIYKRDIEQRNKIKCFFKLISVLRKIKYKRIIHEGWYIPEYIILSFLTPKRKNATMCESSIYESNISGLRGFIKRVIINRCSTALPSGTAHKAIFDAIGFKGDIYITGGVGIFHKPERVIDKDKISIEKKYLYVGRLIECKNLRFLIERFNKNGKHLTIVGKGELEQELKTLSKENITFRGFIENDKLPEVYKEHDIFILPSRTETWGLVVEEAIYWGLPVVVSDRVGCGNEMVITPKTGVTFELDNIDSFNLAINDIEQNYKQYRDNAIAVDFEKRDKKQIDCFLSVVRN